MMANMKVIVWIICFICIGIGSTKDTSGISTISEDLKNAVYGENLPGVVSALEKGADPNYVDKEDHWPPLDYAAWKGYLAICKMLLIHGADPEVTTIGGTTAMWKAAAKGHHDVVQLLIDHGGDPGKPSLRGGWTAICTAALFGHDEVVQLLIDHGADPGKLCGGTPASLAREGGFTQLSNWLLRLQEQNNLQQPIASDRVEL